ncbi:MAG: DUF305 domain-containing protein [Chloroflexota bacterium]
MKKLWFVFGLVGLIFTGITAPAVLANGSIEGRAGRAEVRFLEGMIDHHQMALDMANDCLANASTDSLRTLCQNIINAQSAEIKMMQGWLLSWYNIDYSPMSMSDMTNMMEGSMSATQETSMNMGSMPVTDPPMMMGMMAGLNRLQGVDYDIAFLESMIDHHDDAIHMSQRILQRDPEGTGHPDLRAQAQKIVDDQTAEIKTMEDLLVQLGDS